MTKNIYCERFENILHTLHTENITTISELQNSPALYTDFWYALQDFVNRYALCSKTHTNSKGEKTVGNAEKIRFISSYGTDAEDIRRDIQVHIISKLNLILAQPLKKQKNYCYAICNNCITDKLRGLPSGNISFVSINGKVSSDSDACTYENLIADISRVPEDVCIAKETADIIMAERKEYEECMLAAKKAEILDTLHILGTRPAEMLSFIAVEHLGIKPGKIAELIKTFGNAEKLFAAILAKTAKKYGIPVNQIRSAIKSSLADTQLKTETNNSAAVSAQVSRLVYRAKTRLGK